MTIGELEKAWADLPKDTVVFLDHSDENWTRIVELLSIPSLGTVYWVQKGARQFWMDEEDKVRLGCDSVQRQVQGIILV